MPHDPYAALRHPDFRRLLTASILVSVGAQTLSAAVGWDLYQRTHAAEALGYVGLAQFLPVALLALPSGHLADRVSRKYLFLIAVSLMAAAASGLHVLSVVEGPVALVYLYLVVMGVARALLAPARSALVPHVVPPEDLANAVTWHASTWEVASVVGPALAGAVIGFGSVSTAYALAGGCFALGLVSMARTHPRPVKRAAEPVSVASFFAGLRFVWRTELILAAMTLDLFAVLLGGATALLPVFANDILGLGPVGFGWLRAAPSLGALGMAFAMAHRPPLRRAGRTLLVSVAGFGVATVGFGLSRDPLLSFALLALTGVLDNVSVVVRGTLVQMLTPDEMRGRVAAVNSIFIVSSNELGAFESGMTAAWFGPVASVVGGGIGTMLVVVAVALRWPKVTALGPLHTVVAEPTAEAEAARQEA